MSSYGLWLSAAGMQVQDHRQTLLANNLANVETTGFKQDLAVVSQRRIESREQPGEFQFAHPVLDRLPGGVNVHPPHKDFSSGDIEITGRPLDVAIEGPGFFAVSDGQSTRYTRDGRLTLNRAGDLVLSSGAGRWKTLDSEASPIRLDEAAGPLTISSDGTIRQGSATVATLGVAVADNAQRMRKAGENTFDAAAAVMTQGTAHVVPEAVERSNFDVMGGLAGMIEASRAYEMNARLIQMQDEASGQLIARVAGVA